MSGEKLNLQEIHEDTLLRRLSVMTRLYREAEIAAGDMANRVAQLEAEIDSLRGVLRERSQETERLRKALDWIYVHLGVECDWDELSEIEDSMEARWYRATGALLFGVEIAAAAVSGEGNAQ